NGQVDYDVVDVADLQRAFLMRNNKRIPIDFEKLFGSGDLSQNIQIEPGDYLYFPSADVKEVYVLGEVALPGPVTYRPGMSMLGTISPRLKTPARPNRTQHAQTRTIGNRAGQGHFAQHVNLFDVRRREVKIIARFDLDVLREIAAAEQFLKIDGDALVVAHEKRALQIRHVDDVVIHLPVLDALGLRQRFQHGGGAVERVDTALHDFPKHVIFFAVVGDRRDDGPRRAAEFAQLIIDRLAQAIDRQAAG